MAKKRKPVSVVNLPGYKALLEFMNQQGCNNAKEALIPLRRLFISGADRSEDYMLFPSCRINTAEIISTVNGILLEKPAVTKVKFISFSRPYPRPVWMSESYYKKWFLPEMDFWEDILTNINKPPWPELLKHADKLNSNDKLWEQLHYYLQHNLLYQFEGRLTINMGHFIEDGMEYALMNYLRCCLPHQKGGRFLFKRLVDIWSRCLILGCRVGKPKTLLVLCQ